MNVNQESLLYSVYAIAVFDFLCAMLFAALSMTKIHTHLSWLTIFNVLFGMFWLTLIAVLIFGILKRNSKLVRYWLIFSCVGMFVEGCLIIYAYISQTRFQKGVVKNSFLLFLGLLVESVFAFIIYQFYKALAQCNDLVIELPPVNEKPKPPYQEQCQQTEMPQPEPQPQPQPAPDEMNRKKLKRTKCSNIVQARTASSSCKCEPPNRSYDLRQCPY